MAVGVQGSFICKGEGSREGEAEREREEGDVPQLWGKTIQSSDLLQAYFLWQDDDAAVTLQCSHQCQPNSCVVGSKGNWLTTAFGTSYLPPPPGWNHEMVTDKPQVRASSTGLLGCAGSTGSVGGCAGRQVELQHCSYSSENGRAGESFSPLPEAQASSCAFGNTVGKGFCFRSASPPSTVSCGGQTHRTLRVTPRLAGEGHLCSGFTVVMDGASCSQLEQEGEAAGRSSVSLPGAAGSLVPFQLPQAGREPV